MRDYDPTTGRYIQADPLGLEAGVSLYGYALQNPGRFTDPTGENPLAICATPLGGALCREAAKGVVKICVAGAQVVAGAVAGLLASTSEGCGCDDDCAQLSAQIEELAQSLQLRLEDMMVDQHDLFKTAPTIADNWGKDSWEGHQNRHENERQQLRNLIGQADAKGCAVSEFARQIASESAPDRPLN